MNRCVFVSYGHDAYVPQVKLLIDSLKERNNGYVIWWDNGLQPSADYHRQIENELYELKKNKPNSCFIYIITPYSVDTSRYNYCINEIEKALNDRVKILPIKLTEAQIPIQIGCLQWLDMTQCELDVNNKDFQSRIDAICKIIESTETIKFDGKQDSLNRLLNPCQFLLDIDKHLQNYGPRKWLYEATVDWLENRNERLLLLKGGPGTGKTAYSLWISTRKMPERIHAWHLCQYNDVKTRSLLTCVKSLTWYLASHNPVFYDTIDLPRLEQIIQDGEDSAGVMFKTIILETLKTVHVKDEKVLILIDALDEASENGTNRIANVLEQYADVIPQWLRFIVTTRNDASVVRPLKNISYVIDLDDNLYKEKCYSDIITYVKANLSEKVLAENDGIADVIAERSGNVILYAKLMCSAISKGVSVDILQFPQGLNSYYDAHMRRYFCANANYDFFKYALPVIHIMLASYQPIKKEYIYRRIHDTEDWCKDRTIFMRVLDCFGSLLKKDEDYIVPFHKSFSDWLTNNENNSFYVCREDGMEKMCEWGSAVLSDEFAEEELIFHFYMYQIQYLIDAKRYRDLQELFCSCDFWVRRRDVLGIDLMLQRMFDELSLMSDQVRKRIVKNSGFNDVVYSFSVDLFDKGLFVQLKNNGYLIPIGENLSDKERITALRYYYINGDYTTIIKNKELFGRSYQDKKMEPLVLNLLGLTTKKCGEITRSSEFFKNAIKLSIERNMSWDGIIYYHLNQSRVLTILCNFDEGRKELEMAIDEFYNKDWHSGINDLEFGFKSRQLELAVRYVSVETELFSSSYNVDVCERELAWADQLYSSELRIDRYYPRHLQSKILFLLREHRYDEIESIMEQLDKCKAMGLEDIRTRYYQALVQYAVGHKEEGFRIAKEQMLALQNKDIFLIERVECWALVDTLESKNHLSEIKGELRPWYFHTVSLIKQVMDKTSFSM